ncbi:phosphatase PAP2 family protein [Leadbetterella byssophila]|uniref:Phosphoesterase PA-phosphatase related protein n=1 Tax=Leadbetterella byssophila (strain DSM 17132 / JCM 16389 / KACC 11308 / NBRC 106382 / 4M15) TaxID=649349 RepID=E4RVB6_LEAB4|nr:phosphatase PAP2 family protein [Leadbetterella byssophila]ADQ16102.1 phosphoesterase PA-phosphatase related protein [Leadbetterella byssophila DSM 17132]
MESLLDWDKQLFIFLNGYHTPFWDKFFLIYTNAKSWIPVVLILLVMLFRSFHWKQALVFVALIAIGVGVSDYVASGIMKPNFARLRPCHDYLNEMILVGNCGGKYGFASSHAANAFGIFMGFSLVFSENKRLFWVLLAWATLMGYSRIYVGVHHPGDVIVGALIGILVPQIIFYLYKKIKLKS